MKHVFYVYQHRRLDTNEIFYIGKGKEKRAYSNYGRNKYWHSIVKKAGYIVEFVDTDLDEETAFELEIFTIEFYGRKDLGLGTLINLTDGGDGSSGYIYSEELKNNSRIRTIGCKNPRARKVINQFGDIFLTAKEASIWCNLKNQTCISSCCNNIQNFAGKHPTTNEELVWMFLHPKLGERINTIKIKKLILRGENHPNYGKIVSKETKNKLSISGKGKNLGDKNPMFGKFGKDSPSSRKVTNQFGDIFNSIKEASIWCNSCSSAIVNCCSGKSKYSGKHPITNEKLIWNYQLN